MKETDFSSVSISPIISRLFELFQETVRHKSDGQIKIKLKKPELEPRCFVWKVATLSKIPVSPNHGLIVIAMKLAWTLSLNIFF